jgi:hydroxymethylbilane synthase
LAQIENGAIHFKGNILSVDGKQKVDIERTIAKNEAEGWGSQLANELLKNGGQVIADGIRSK